MFPDRSSFPDASATCATSVTIVVRSAIHLPLRRKPVQATRGTPMPARREIGKGNEARIAARRRQVAGESPATLRLRRQCVLPRHAPGPMVSQIEPAFDKLRHVR
jgi:hypothetical protein